MNQIGNTEIITTWGEPKKCAPSETLRAYADTQSFNDANGTLYWRPVMISYCDGHTYTRPQDFTPVEPSPLPEPSAFLLLFSGLLLLVLLAVIVRPR